MQKKTGKKTKIINVIISVLLILSLCGGIATDVLYSRYQAIVESTFADTSDIASQEYQDAALAASRDLNIRLEEEGAVLLKNEGNVLPLADKSKVNLYGIMSGGLYLNGSGSSSTNARSITLKEALENDGMTVNPDIWSVIEKNYTTDTGSAQVGDASDVVEELSIDTYEAGQSFQDARAYSEIAIVTIGRTSGEGDDPYREGNGRKDHLEMQSGEIALLRELHDQGFRVVTLINSSFVLELGPAIACSDAILWVGGPGEYGIEGIANLLAGKNGLSPSGRLSDTWMYDQETSSSYYTSWADTNEYVDENGKALNAHYTNFNEGIYVGYRWYETADKEGFWAGYTSEWTGDRTGYEAVVAYPFGYGLSYTTFEEKLAQGKGQGGQLVFEAEVRNSGKLPGKDVVEIYVEKPYTDGGAEVPVVELLGFAKTRSLKSGEKEKLSITVSTDDLAVWDARADGGRGAYHLLGGEYTFYLADGTTGAHVWAKDDAQKVSVHIDEKVYADTPREGDRVVARNLLEVTDSDTGVASNDDNAGFRELSRAGGFENAGETILVSAFDAISGRKVLSSGSPVYEQLMNHFDDYNTDHFESLTDADITADLEMANGLTFQDMIEKDADGNSYYSIDQKGNVITSRVDYLDPRWNALLSQMTEKELSELMGHAGYGTIKIESIGKDYKSKDYDGPFGIANFMKSTMGIEQSATSFCSEPVMASTRNLDLMRELGEKIAAEANACGYSGIYAPAVNLHRTPYGGRNAEYFSEDAYLSGAMCACEVQGMMSKGLYAFVKHFAFNDIEAWRLYKMNIWISEQAARELYLKPFEMAVKDGGATGIMSSYMVIGGQWTGASYNLIKGILRDEWGFQGAVVTDTDNIMMNTNKMLAAGSNLLLASSYKKKVDKAVYKTEEGLKAMKTSARQTLWMIASAAVNRDIPTSEGSQTTTNTLFIGLNCLFYGLAVLFAVLLIWRARKARKHANQIA
ncbi:MAG: glycoside hydrolase family 3 protein [Clostridia bacterium]|nr:glycoside hydrolase family 3 protein [Clostridia bacterium]